MVRVKARKIEWRHVGEVGKDRGGVEDSAVFVHGVRWGPHDDCEDVRLARSDMNVETYFAVLLAPWKP